MRPASSTLVDGGFLMWTYGTDHWKRRGWQTAKFEYARDLGVIIVLDGGSKYRQDFYPEYKSARRDRYEEDLDRQERKASVIEFADKVLERDPMLSVLKMPGHEADDIVAALCLRHPTYLKVIGTDKDLIQLGHQNIRLERHTGMFVTLEHFTKTLPKTIQPFITRSSQIVRLLTCMGDKSDSIPRLIPPGLTSLRTFARYLQEPDFWGFVADEYGEEEVKRNLYLSILPGPFIFEKPLSPDEVFELMRFSPTEYYQQSLEPSLEEFYQKNIIQPQDPNQILKELGF